MLVLELERRKQRKSQAKLGADANVDPSYVCRAERYGYVYPGHLCRLADALGWEGEPGELLKEVE